MSDHDETLGINFFFTKKVNYEINFSFSRKTLLIRLGQLLPSQLWIYVSNGLNVSDVLVASGNRPHICEHLQLTISIPYRLVFF